MRNNRALICGTVLLGAALSSGCAKQSKSQALLEIEPAVVRDCDLPTALGVRWDASALGLESTQLEVNNVGGRPKLWIRDHSVGEAHTGGTWAEDGFTVTLRAINGVELARRTLTSVPCKKKR